jgi:hypothetical protein
VVLLEGLDKSKNFMTLSELQPATFLLVDVNPYVKKHNEEHAVVISTADQLFQ